MRTQSRLTPRLRQALRWLRKNFPVKTPTIVRVVPKQPGLFGLCEIGDGRALVRITSDTDNVMIEVLIEEYCHVLRSECPIPEKVDHDGLFWAILAHVTLAWRGDE